MLPAAAKHRFSLADVMPSCLAALVGSYETLDLGHPSKIVVVVVDGLGTHPLLARAGHARTLASQVTRATTIGAGFPSTTASALTTLTTGVLPGTHGMVGYAVLDAAHDRVVNQLSGWDDRMVPEAWQSVPTVFETAAAHHVPSFVVAPEKYRASGFTRAVLRGAEYIAAGDIEARFAHAREVLDSVDTALIYLYVPELDQAAHAQGNDSSEWTRWLEIIDDEVGRFAAKLTRNERMLVTADHGGVDVPSRSHVVLEAGSQLLEGVRHIAGEPRCLQLHLEPGADAGAVLDRWMSEEGRRSWVFGRDEAVAYGLFGGIVSAEALSRMGDIFVAARARIAYYDGRAKNQSGRKMIGQHGSLTAEETAIPLLRFGF